MKINLICLLFIVFEVLFFGCVVDFLVVMVGIFVVMVLFFKGMM